METFMHSDTVVSDIDFIADIAVKFEECKIDNESVIKKDMQKLESQNLPCISVMFVSKNKYRCRICNVDSSCELDLMTHVKGKKHAAAQKKYGCENISPKEDSLYYCRCCDSRLSSCTLAFQHIKTKGHMNNTRFFSIFDMLVDIKNYHCIICDNKSSGEIDLQNHLKGKKHEDAQKKYVRDNISLKDENLYYCGCCDTTLSDSKLVCKHIKEEKHMRNANIPCIFVTWVNVKKYLCRICNLNLSGEIELQNHVQGKQHLDAQTKYGCENISRKEGNLYYCECCDCTLSSRKLASEHVTEEKHMIKANLPCISIMPKNKNNYHCTICGVNFSGEIALQNHVKGKEHSTAQKKHGCENISRKEGNLYYCECCECTLSTRKVASDHIAEEQHMIKANLPCISIMPKNKNNYHCTICGVNFTGEIALQNHVKGKEHSTAQKKHGCENISRKEGNLYYCECCECTLSTRKVASDHIAEEQHMIKANLLCISIMPKKKNRYYCKICGVKFSGEINLINHVKGKQHSTAQKKHGCEYISRKEGNLYYCECCDCTLSSRKLASEHVTEEKHMIKANLPCISIMPMNENNYHCNICGVNNTGEIDLKNHVKGKQHSTAQKKHGCEYISRKEGNLYYCVCCDCTLSSRKLASEHVTEEKHMSNANLPCISITLVENSKYRCKICDITILEKSTLENHVKGSQHAAAKNKYGCENISRKEGNLYYCECCDCTLSSRELACNHITEEKHMIKANLPCISIMPRDKNNYHCTICGVNSSSEIDLKNHVKGKQHSTAQKKHGCENISRKEGNLYYCECCDCTLSSRELACNHITEEKHMIKANLPCISVMPRDKNNYHCTICGVNSSSEIDLKNHVKGKQHSTAQKKHGCENISRKEGNLYYCECCECTLSSRKVASDHIVEEQHMINANLPCISIMPKNKNNYHCTICGVNSSSEIDLKNHVKGKQHSTAQKKHGCENISRKEGNLYYCECCECTLSSRKVASDHIVEEQHMINANLPCISIMPKNKNNYHCTICGVNSSSEIDLKNHVKGKQHSTAQKKHGCKNISRINGNIHYCLCCEFTFPSRKFASEHITERKHISNSNLPCISIMQVEKNKYHCRICNITSFGEKDLEIHVKDKIHLAAQKEYGCDTILQKENNLYYCKCCDSTLPNRKIAYDHINQEKHINALKLSNMQDQTTITEVPKKAESIKKPESIAEPLCQQSLGSYILKQDATNSYCAVCDCPINGNRNVNEHVTGFQHAKLLKKFSDNSIYVKVCGSYYCGYCSCDILGFDNIQSHIAGIAHANSISMKKLALDNQEQRTGKKKVTVEQKPKQPDDAPAAISQTLLDNFIVKVEKDLYCRVCECKIIDHTKVNDHVTKNEHTTGLKKFHENQITIKDNKYYCRYCNCNIWSCWHVNQHIIGKRHIGFLKVSNQGEKVTEQILSNLKTVIFSLNTKRSKLEKTLGLKLTTKEKTVKMLCFKKTKANKIFDSEKGQMRCHVCNASVEGAKNLHIHLARHFSNDFTTCNEEQKMVKMIDTESLQIEQNNVTKTEGTSRFEHTDNVNCKEKAFCKRAEKKRHMKKIIKDFDFDDNDIYSMEDRTADIELGMKLSFVIEKDMIYCLVCQKIISTSIQDYYEHLRSIDHCEYLDRMEKDHELFDYHPDQFSQLKLALQYMEEMTNDVVRCLACDQEIDNLDIALQEHIDDKDHNQNCVKLNTRAKENFMKVKLMHCDWYQVQSYWCVPCITTFRSEVKFAKHLKSEIHADNMKQKQNAKRKLMLDYCASCALLWYGYRCTWDYHYNVPSHIWLTRDRHYTLTEIPISVESLLAKPEDYINKTIEYLDDVSTKEREKEGILIRDLEKSVKTKFIHAKAYTFGSRVSGLGSPDCDIDVFLDCGNMYNGESSSLEQILNIITDVHECLIKEPEAWDIEELLTTCRSPIIKAHHRVTGLSCDISFENGLAVENTLLIKSFNDIFPSCRKIILILKQWLKLCKLSGSERITSYALYWIVIFYLQKESILPSIATLIEMKKRSHVIAGWETGVSRDFTYNQLEHNFSIKELLTRFFTFYANFDYRQDVACPLLGDVIAKRAFTDPQTLPKQMDRYVAHVNNSGEFFGIDSVMCIQDPFDLQHNLSKAVSKVYVNRFRKYCSKSLDVLCAI